jgi:hypothetical protein
MSRIYEEEATWKAIIRTNVLFNFIQQLKHIGVLAVDTRSHSGKISEYIPDSKPRALREAGGTWVRWSGRWTPLTTMRYYRLYW